MDVYCPTNELQAGALRNMKGFARLMQTQASSHRFRCLSEAAMVRGGPQELVAELTRQQKVGGRGCASLPGFASIVYPVGGL